MVVLHGIQRDLAYGSELPQGSDPLRLPELYGDRAGTAFMEGGLLAPLVPPLSWSCIGEAFLAPPPLLLDL